MYNSTNNPGGCGKRKAFEKYDDLKEFWNINGDHALLFNSSESQVENILLEERMKH